MESVAPPGGVMLSESTARLVEHATVLGATEWVKVKGAEEPLPARRLLRVAAERARIGRREPTLVGRVWEMSTVAGILEQAIGGAGHVVAVVGPPGIGKSRIMGEAVTLATGRGVEVSTVVCESHTRESRSTWWRDCCARCSGSPTSTSRRAGLRCEPAYPMPTLRTCCCSTTCSESATPTRALPAITADARRRRLAAIVEASSGQIAPAQYVIEDVHWIDEVSEAMVAECATWCRRATH